MKETISRKEIKQEEIHMRLRKGSVVKKFNLLKKYKIT